MQENFSAACSTDIAGATSYVAKLTSTMQQLLVVQPQSHRQQRAQLNQICRQEHMSLSGRHITRGLAYDGPLWVLKRDPKFFTLDINGRKNTVSLDRLKPAHLDNPCLPWVRSSCPTVPSASGNTTSLLPEPQTRITS